MHKSDIDRLEDILSNPNKYKQYLKLREFELEYKEPEPDGKVIHPDAQDQRTIKANGTVSTVEKNVISKMNDVQYQTLYSIVTNAPKFVDSLNKYERVIYKYRYCEEDLSVYEWEDIAMKLTNMTSEDDKSFSKSTTLRLRNKMLERLADYVGHTLM